MTSSSSQCPYITFVLREVEVIKAKAEEKAALPAIKKKSNNAENGIGVCCEECIFCFPKENDPYCSILIEGDYKRVDFEKDECKEKIVSVLSQLKEQLEKDQKKDPLAGSLLKKVISFHEELTGITVARQENTVKKSGRKAEAVKS